MHIWRWTCVSKSNMMTSRTEPAHPCTNINWHVALSKRAAYTSNTCMTLVLDATSYGLLTCTQPHTT